jgi:hypothetical protein
MMVMREWQLRLRRLDLMLVVDETVIRWRWALAHTRLHTGWSMAAAACEEVHTDALAEEERTEIRGGR